MTQDIKIIEILGEYQDLQLTAKALASNGNIYEYVDGKWFFWINSKNHWDLLVRFSEFTDRPHIVANMTIKLHRGKPECPYT